MKKNKLTLLSAAVLGAALLFGAPEKAYAAETHEVQSGDTMYHIALDHNISLDDLIKINPAIVNPSLIFPGELINLSGDAVAAPTAPVESAPVYVAPETTPVYAAPTGLASSDYELLAMVVAQEAGEGYQSAVGVMSTIVNRANDGRFGSGIMGVVTAPNQFQAYGDGHYTRYYGRVPQATYDAVNYVLANGPTHSYLYFRASGDGRTNVYY